MKKNLLSIIILSLLVVNIVLTTIMMMSVMSTNQKTAAIVTDIAGILNIELGRGDSVSGGHVSLEDTVVYSIPEEMKITMRRGENDERDTLCIVKVSLSMDSKHEDFAKYGDGAGDLSNMEARIKSEIIAVVGSYTADEAKLSQQEMCDEILKRIQILFDGSTFIYNVSFSDIMFASM